MDTVLSAFKTKFMLHLVTCLILMVVTTDAKIKGTFQCTKPQKAIKCSTANLPAITNGSFDCAPNSDVSKGEACTLTCNDGFYPASSDKVMCKVGPANQGGVWSDENFACHAITCSTATLPKITNGSFDCAPNSDISKGEACALTCNDGFYPASYDQAICEAGTANHGGVWSDGNFTCHVTESLCYQWKEWNGSEYKLTSTIQSWEESHQLCKNYSCHLVTIENKEENNFVQKMMKYCTYFIWIGLNDRDTEGTWEWRDHTDAVYRNWNKRKWYREQPDGGEGEDCVVIGVYTGKWYDLWCSHNSQAVCERKKSDG